MVTPEAVDSTVAVSVPIFAVILVAYVYPVCEGIVIFTEYCVLASNVVTAVFDESDFLYHDTVVPVVGIERLSFPVIEVMVVSACSPVAGSSIPMIVILLIVLPVEVNAYVTVRVLFVVSNVEDVELLSFTFTLDAVSRLLLKVYIFDIGDNVIVTVYFLSLLKDVGVVVLPVSFHDTDFTVMEFSGLVIVAVVEGVVPAFGALTVIFISEIDVACVSSYVISTDTDVVDACLLLTVPFESVGVVTEILLSKVVSSPEEMETVAL